MVEQKQEVQEQKQEVTQQQFIDMYIALCKQTGWKIAISQQTEQTIDGGLINVSKLAAVKAPV